MALFGKFFFLEIFAETLTFAQKTLRFYAVVVFKLCGKGGFVVHRFGQELRKIELAYCKIYISLHLGQLV